MSAPRTPAEMADWLEDFAASQWERDLLVRDESAGLHDIVTYLRAVPTDAQKIEALKLASIAGFTMSGQFPPEALRLLGLPTE